MSLKNAALLALIGMILLTVLLTANLITDVLAAMRGLIPDVRLLSSLVYFLASLSVTVFFYVFHKSQS
jgi:hypothetical protein